MYVFWGVIVLAAGFFMLFAPKTCYDITQGWKNSMDTDPSPLFLLSTRLGGIFFILAGTAAIVVSFLH